MDTSFKTVVEGIKHWADISPDKDAVVFVNNGIRSYAFTSRDLYVMSGRFASRLRHSDFQPGDLIGNTLLNSPERVVTDCGIILARCVTINIGVIESDGKDFWETTSRVQCRGIIVRKSDQCPVFRLLHPYITSKNASEDGGWGISIPHLPCLTKIFLIARRTSCEHARSKTSAHDEESSERSAATQSTFDDNAFERIAKQEEKKKADEVFSTQICPEYLIENLSESHDEILDMETHPSDDVIIFLTSGTTGYSKLVPRSNEELINTHLGYGDNSIDKYFTDLGFEDKPTYSYFCNRHLGWLGGFLLGYFVNNVTRYMQDCFNGESHIYDKQFWNFVESEKIDCIYLFPHEITQLVETCNGNLGYKIPVVVTGGLPVTQSTVSASRSLCYVLDVVYGSTETGYIALNRIYHSAEQEYKDFMVGRPFRDVEVTILDENGRQLFVGEHGRIAVKTPRLFRGFYKGKPANDILTSDGFLYVGDSGYLDVDGNLYVTGRDDSSFFQNHRSMYTSWPEMILSRCPEIRDVIVVKVNENYGSEKVCACVVPYKDSGLTKSRLLKFYEDVFLKSGEASLQTFPTLDGILFFEDGFPLTFNGKYDRQKLKKLAQEKLELVGETK